jgi:hypothetical protein
MYSHAKQVSSPLRHYFFADFLLKEICKTFSSHLLVMDRYQTIHHQIRTVALRPGKFPFVFLRPVATADQRPGS